MVDERANGLAERLSSAVMYVLPKKSCRLGCALFKLSNICFHLQITGRLLLLFSLLSFLCRDAATVNMPRDDNYAFCVLVVQATWTELDAPRSTRQSDPTSNVHQQFRSYDAALHTAVAFASSSGCPKTRHVPIVGCMNENGSAALGYNCVWRMLGCCMCC